MKKYVLILVLLVYGCSGMETQESHKQEEPQKPSSPASSTNSNSSSNSTSTSSKIKHKRHGSFDHTTFQQGFPNYSFSNFNKLPFNPFQQQPTSYILTEDNLNSLFIKAIQFTNIKIDEQKVIQEHIKNAETNYDNDIFKNPSVLKKASDLYRQQNAGLVAQQSVEALERTTLNANEDAASTITREKAHKSEKLLDILLNRQPEKTQKLIDEKIKKTQWWFQRHYYKTTAFVGLACFTVGAYARPLVDTALETGFEFLKNQFTSLVGLFVKNS
ncbi:MAG: hypothetical protein AB7E68_05800 [Candidatus Babeliales bacterium]